MSRNAGWPASHPEYDIYIGASYLEADDDQFYNTFALFGPGGELLGRVCKGSLPAFEGWYFAPSAEPKVIDTDVGRLGIGICTTTRPLSSSGTRSIRRPICC
ncbi:carbon-nitrogen hydrolase family protein [Nocardia sp. CDC159]|uniref:Carbon-nitrogen hydrolase family protein n=1 Tax=Nocardia pulmonis TaxID=2951408 RepID=A0A9X2EI92_9NOCA|nr:MULTISPECIES: carbon-nitrogen hydrolase family protein [Nocardia]MCM6778723.1 carbon-nitrogen hydrolase family protein [Nocardia pulmonis]MCM6791612.1 carbon-nitrogen hydrolase family protein [Nocardia sp. CDC159]